MLSRAITAPHEPSRHPHAALLLPTPRRAIAIRQVARKRCVSQACSRLLSACGVLRVAWCVSNRSLQGWPHACSPLDPSAPSFGESRFSRTRHHSGVHPGSAGGCGGMMSPLRPSPQAGTHGPRRGTNKQEVAGGCSTPISASVY